MNKITRFSTITIAILSAASLCACTLQKTAIPIPAASSTVVQTPPPPTSTTVPTPEQGMDSLEYLEIFEIIWGTVDQTFFDPEFGGVDWKAVHDDYQPLVSTAQDDQTLYRLLNQMLWELKVSHAAVGPADEWASAEPIVWESGTIGIDVRLLKEAAGGDTQAVVTRVEAGSPADAAGLKPGFIIQRIDGKPVAQILLDIQDHLAPPYNPAGQTNGLTNHLLSLIYGDPGTCVALAYLDENNRTQESCIERIQRPWEVSMTGAPLPPFYLEFESRRLASGVGYIRFNTFYPDLMPVIAEAVAGLQDAPGIILDLRGNPGGELETDGQVASLFLDGQVPFGKIMTRAGTTDWMLTGEGAYAGPLVILIDELSFSGSEFVTSGMQSLGRAVVIGGQSPGGAIAANVKLLPKNAVLVFPVAQLLTTDGKVVEGRGVIPDLRVTLARDQLLDGIDAQLQAAIEYIENLQN